ncbi:MAG TPA: GNAT family N-acetyltransferase [Flavobacteriales bacterium]|nr:GNAT family N-acetyltransferase [Flavobacteriales bacterium]
MNRLDKHVYAERTDFRHRDFVFLTEYLDKELRANDGDEADYYANFNKIDNIQHVILVYEGNVAVACGAFKPYKDKTVEIKRMFVPFNHRGKRFSSFVLHELEKWAMESGYTSAILETGKTQTAAIHLYQKKGYKIIPNYDQYVGVKNSVCMFKDLTNG